MDDSTKIHTHDNNMEILTYDEEQRLFEQYKSLGTPELRNQIALHNLKLVYKIASSFKLKHIDIEELKQEGFFGLIDAIDSFDCSRGIKFSSYAYPRIYYTIRRYIDNNLNTVRLPIRLLYDYQRISKYINDYNEKYKNDPTLNIISDELGLSEKRIKEILAACKNQQSLSLEFMISKDSEKNIMLIDTIENEKASKAIQRAEQQFDITLLLKEIRKITSQTEYDILMMRYGFLNEEPYTLKDIGKVFNMTPNQVRRVEQRVLKRLATSKSLTLFR